jgi:hypothetical protein
MPETSSSGGHVTARSIPGVGWTYYADTGDAPPEESRFGDLKDHEELSKILFTVTTPMGGTDEETDDA